MIYLGQRVRVSVYRGMDRKGNSQTQSYGEGLVTEYRGETVAGSLYTVKLDCGETKSFNHKHLTVLLA